MTFWIITSQISQLSIDDGRQVSMHHQEGYSLVPIMHLLTTSSKWLFSRAAATLSLSANCLLTAASDWWAPGNICTVTLNLDGSERNSFTLIQRPISVAMEQWGIVGVNWMTTVFLASFTWIFSMQTTLSCSKVSGCSGSFKCLICSKISSLVTFSLSSSLTTRDSPQSVDRLWADTWWIIGFALIKDDISSSR